MCICIYMCVYIHIHICICIYIQIYVYISIRIYFYIFTYIYIYSYIYICSYIWWNIHMYMSHKNECHTDMCLTVEIVSNTYLCMTLTSWYDIHVI